MNYPKGLYEKSRVIKTAEQMEKEATEQINHLINFRLKFTLSKESGTWLSGIAEIENYGTPHARTPNEMISEVMSLTQMMAQLEQAKSVPLGNRRRRIAGSEAR
jgi:hypothetical protein